MADKTSIEWADSTWNPIKSIVLEDAPTIAIAKGYGSLVQIAERNIGKVGWHCEHASTGCGDASGGGCYAEGINHRCLPKNGTGLPYDRRSRDLLDIFLDEEELLKPLRWKKPRSIFPCSMTDWCAEFVTDEMRDRMLAVAALCSEHRFLFLTKRADRCAEYFADGDWAQRAGRVFTKPTTLPNVWLGFSAENQECFDARWSHMRKLAVAGWKVWCSAEPLLGAIDASRALAEGLSWMVVGGESGHYARPMNIQWVRDIIRQCRDAGVACFVKQMGAHPVRYMGINGALELEAFAGTPIDRTYAMKLNDRKGGDMSEWSEDLRVRDVPR